MNQKIKKLSASNWEDLLRATLKPVADAELQVVQCRPWRCSECGTTKAGIARDGAPTCYQCSIDTTLVPGQSVDLDRRYAVAHVAAPGLPGGVLAVTAGNHLVSPMANRHFKLGMPADDFVRELRARALPCMALHVDEDGIWRRSDRSRADGADVADLVFGLRGGIWTAEEIDGFAE